MEARIPGGWAVYLKKNPYRDDVMLLQYAIPRDQVIVGHTPTQKRDMTGNKIQSLWSIIIKALMTSQPIVLELIIYIETLCFYAC